MGAPFLDTLEKADLGGLARIDRGKRKVTNSSSECTTCDRTINKLILQNKCKTIEMIWCKVKVP
jgi:hypothetical protein